MDNHNNENTRIFPFEECAKYVDILQDNINRVASNSANCKSWLSAMIVGALAIAFSTDVISNRYYFTTLMIVLCILTIIFFALDCYYFGYQRHLTYVQRDFVAQCKKQPQDKNMIKELLFRNQTMEEYQKKDDWNHWKSIKKGGQSWSEWPFYAVILALLLTICIVPYCQQKSENKKETMPINDTCWYDRSQGPAGITPQKYEKVLICANF